MRWCRSRARGVGRGGGWVHRWHRAMEGGDDVHGAAVGCVVCEDPAMALLPGDMREASLDGVRSVAREELRRLFRHVVSEAGDDVYFFGLTVVDRHLSPMVVANSMTSLNNREGRIYAIEGVTDFEIDPWDPGQWRWVVSCPRIGRITGDLEKQHDAWEISEPGAIGDTWTPITQRLDNLFIEVLIELDGTGTFGPSRERDHAALLYMDANAFTDDDWRTMFRRLNPPDIEQRLLQAWGLTAGPTRGG